MFLFFSKLFLVFLHPVNWLIILLLFRYLIVNKRLQRLLLVATIVIFTVFSNKALYSLVVNNWQPAPVQLTGKTFTAGVLLGGISMFSKNGDGYFGDAADRYIQTQQLYQQGIIKKIIVSGGRITDDVPREANFLATQLISSGVAHEDIFIENRSRNTFENARYTKTIIDSCHIEGPLVLITSAFHMKRAVKVFERAGLKVIPYPCDYKVINSRLKLSDYFWPDMEVLTSWDIILKEWVGILVYQWTGRA